MRPVIDIRNVHRIFESEAGCAHILHNVSLAVNPGEFVAITGPSGSGKSTLMNILGCLDKPTAGDYYLQGLNVAELDDDELTEVRALSIGFVFQSFNLLPRLSVIENVMLPLAYTNVPRSQREMRAVHALQAVTLPVDHWDHRISELSGGQMQRVAIARALVNDPPIILADEPTGNLDSTSAAEVLGFLRRSVDEFGQTVVMVTHDAHAASYADRVVFLSDGRIIDEVRGASQDDLLGAMSRIYPRTPGSLSLSKGAERSEVSDGIPSTGSGHLDKLGDPVPEPVFRFPEPVCRFPELVEGRRAQRGGWLGPLASLRSVSTGLC